VRAHNHPSFIATHLTTIDRILTFNLGFTTASTLADINPNMFSFFGQLMVVVWGIVFIAAGKTRAGPAVWGAFAIEKLCYVAGWLIWAQENPDAFGQTLQLVRDVQSSGGAGFAEALALTFHCIYGPIDAVFMVLFMVQAIRGNPVTKHKEA
jgi:hypothetical protein